MSIEYECAYVDVELNFNITKLLPLPYVVDLLKHDPALGLISKYQGGLYGGTMGGTGRGL